MVAITSFRAQQPILTQNFSHSCRREWAGIQCQSLSFLAGVFRLSLAVLTRARAFVRIIEVLFLGLGVPENLAANV